MVGGVLGATVATLIVGLESLTVTELFGIVVPAQSVGTAAVLAAVAPRRRPWRSALGVDLQPDDLWGLLVGVGLQIVLATLVAVAVELFFEGSPPTQEVVEEASLAGGAMERALVVIGAAVLAPAVEEVVFRGVLLRALLERHSEGFAIVASSATFGAVHLLDPNALLAVPFLFVLGLVLARQTVRTGRIGRAMMTHSGFNLVTVVAVFSVG